MKGLRKFFRSHFSKKAPLEKYTLLPQDKAAIEGLTKEEVIVAEKQKELQKKEAQLEREIILIQRSTKVTFPVFATLHNNLRMKFRWYYKWHMSPFASAIHWVSLSGYMSGIVALIFTSVFATSVIRTFASSQVAWGTQEAWQSWTISGLSTADNPNSLSLSQSAKLDSDITQNQYQESGNAILAYTPAKGEFVDWLSIEASEVLNGGAVKKEFSTDNILFSSDVLEMADSETLYIRLTLSTGDASLSPVLHSLTLLYSRLPNTPTGLSFTADKSLFRNTQTLSASSYLDIDNDTQNASEWQISTKSGDYASPIFDQTKTEPKDELTNIKLTTLLTEGTYYSRVRYQDSVGAWSPWSQEYSFVIAKEEGQKNTTISNNGTDQILANPNEIVADRTETTKTIDNKNGTKTLESYTGLVHYKEDYAKADSSWKDINPNHSIDTPEYVLFDQMPSTVKVFKDKIGYEIESRQTGDKYTVTLKDVDGNPVLSKSKGTDSKVAWADINTPDQKMAEDTRNALSKWIAPQILAEDSQVTTDDGNLKFEFDISEYGVRLWKTIKGEDAPKNFQWNVTKTDGGKEGSVVVTDPETKENKTVVVKDDLKFRDKPEAFDVNASTGEVVKDETGQDKVVAVEAKKIEGSLDSSFVWQETAPKSDMKIDTDVIYYPNTHTEVTSVDGYTYSSRSNWDWASIRSGGYSAADDGTSGDMAAIAAGNNAAWAYVSRSAFLFDTSSIPNTATISAANFSVYGAYKMGDPSGWNSSLGLYSSNPSSNTSLQASDYDTFGTTAFASAIPYASYNDMGYNDFAMNASGLAAISTSGVTKLGLRITADAADSQPTINADYDSVYFYGYFAENDGTALDPKLTVTYSGGNTISGTIYDGIGGSVLGADIPISITSNGGGKMSGVTGSGGTFSFSGVELVAGKPVTIFIDNDPSYNSGSIVYLPESAIDKTGLNMYRYKTTLYSDYTAGAITNADLAIADDCGCFSDFSVSGSTLSTMYDLYVTQYTMFTPGGNVNAYGMYNDGIVEMEANNLTLSSSFYQAGGEFNAGSGTHILATPTFSGGTFNANTSNLTLSNYQITVSTGATFNGDTATITMLNASFAMSGGTFTSTSGTLTITTDSNGYYSDYTWNISGGTFNNANGTFKIGSIPANSSYNPYTFTNVPPIYNYIYANTGDGTVGYSAGFTVSNDFSVTNGYLSPSYAVVVGRDAAISSGAYFSGSDITIGRNLTTTAGGTFSPYVVTFDTAQESVISGDNAPSSFTCATAGKTLSFAADSTQTISGALTIQGAAGNNIVMKLNGTAGSGQWKINANTSGMSPWTVDRVTYSDSNNLNSRPIAPTNSTASGSNNTNWLGSHISGTAYQGIGQGNVGSGQNVSASVNGGAKQTMATDGNGAFDFVAGGVTAGTVITIFFEDGNYSAGNIVTVAAGSSDITGLSLYSYLVSLTYEDSGPMTNTILATADNCSDANGKILFSVDGSNVLSTSYSLHIPASKVYTPGASVGSSGAYIYGTINATATFTSSDMGSFYVESGAVFNAGTGTVTVGGLYLNGGTFNSNSSTLVLNGYSTTIISGTFNSNTATVTIKSYNFYLYGGTFNAPAQVLTLDANDVATDFLFDMSGGGTFVNNDGAVWINNINSANTYYVKCGSNQFYQLSANSANGTVVTQDTLLVEHSLNITLANTFNAYGYNVETKHFAQDTGTFSAPNGTMKVSGDFIRDGGTFSNNYGTVELNSASLAQVVGGSTEFYNFTMTTSTARTISFNPGTNQTVTGQWTATGIADNLLTLQRNGTGAQWEITPSTSMDNQWTVDYVSVSNSKNNAANPISPTNWTKGVNVTNWDVLPGCVWDGGGTGNNWSTAENWTLDTVPDAACDVVFDSTSTKASTLDSGFTAHIKSLSINTGYTDTVTLGADLNDDGALNLAEGTLSAGNYTINIGGSWNNTGGTFTKGTSTVNFNGTAAATVASNSNDFYNITVAGQAGTISTPYAWIANSGATTTTKIDTSSNAVTTHTIGAAEFGVAVDNSGFIWQTNRSNGTLTKINASTNSVDASITIGSDPYGVAIDSNGFVWVASGTNNVAYKINPTTNAIAATVNVGARAYGIAADSSGFVWVANFNSNTVSKINATTDTVVATITVGTQPAGVAVDLNGFVWVPNYGTSDVSKINPTTNTVVATVSAGTNAFGVAADANGFVWVSNLGTNTVTKINTATNAVAATVTVGSAPCGVAVDASGFVWVTNSSANSVSKINGSTNVVAATINTGLAPYSLGDFTGYAYKKIVLSQGGTGSITLSDALVASNNLTVSSGTFTSGANAVTVGSFIQTDGTFAAPSTTMSVANDFTHTAGTFTHNSGTVVFNGGDSSIQDISGDTTFSAVTIQPGATTTKTLKFEASKTQTIAGALTVSGASGRVISLNSSSDGSTWSIDPQSTRAISYASVKDSINANATAIYTDNSGSNVTSAGNNVNWFASAPPNAASTVAITSIDSTLFTVTWTDNSSDETGFKVFTAAGNADCSAASYSGTPDYTTAADATSQAITGKTINTQYCAKVIATNADGDSDPAFAAPKYTLANTPDAPTVTAYDWSAASGNNMAAVINVNSNPAGTEFALSCNATPDSWLQGDGTCGASKVWKTKVNWETGTVNYLKNLTSNTLYSVKALARNGDTTETSASSAGTATSAPAQPASLTHTANTASQISWDWADVAGASSYRLLKSSDDSDVGSPSASAYDQGSLSANTQYTNYVRAYNGVLGQASSTASAYSSIEAASGITFGTIATDSIQVSATGTFTNLSVGSSGLYITKSAGTGTGFASWNTNNNTLTNTGLSPNTQYSYTAQARNGDGETTAATDSISKYTLAAAPDAPTLAASSASVINIKLTDNSSTTYAIAVSADGGSTWNYVKHADGTNQASEDWQNYAAWGGASGFDNVSLSPNVQYTYKVKARNGDNTETAFSSTAAKYTLANVPSAPTVDATSSSSLTVKINQNSNPAGTNYAVYNDTLSKYVQADGSSDTSAVWQDYTTWGGASGVTNTGLTANTEYTYKVKAKNGDNVETALSSGTAQTTVDVAPTEPNTVAIGTLTTTGFTVTWTDASSNETGFKVYTAAGNADCSAASYSGTPDYTTAAGAISQAITSKSINTQYCAKVIATNAIGDSAPAYAAPKYTLAAAPDAPTLAASSASVINIKLTDNSSTTYAIAVSADGGSTWNYVKHADGTNQASEDWQNYAAWGGASGFDNVSLSPNVQYTYKVKARNGDNTETAFSSTAAKYTLANVPGTPTFGTVTSTTIPVLIAQNSNPSNTTYAIKVVYGATTKYVQANSTLGDSAVWQAYATWGSSKTVTGLTANTLYTFSVAATNGDSVATAYSATADQSTLAVYTLTYNSGANGSVIGSSPQTVDHGSSGSEVVATPAANYHFVKWSDNDSTNPVRTDTNVTANITTTASFAIDTHTLAYSAGANGSIVGTTPQTIDHGASGSEVTATPAANYHFVSWSDDVMTAARTDSNVAGDIAVTASFAIDTHTLTYSAGANGSIVGTTPQTVDHGSSGSEVTATPAANYHFVSWSDDVMTAARTDLNVADNISVTATFAINTYTLTYNAGSNGSVVGTSPQTVDYGANGSQVTATPAAGYYFVDWSDANTTAARTDTNVTVDITVTANFALQFLSRWDTSKTSSGSSTATQIHLPLESTGTYNFIVDWGDSSTSTITTWNQAETTHTYASGGIYDLKIGGTITGFRFNNAGDKLKLSQISQFGPLRLGNSDGYFSGTKNLKITATDVLNTTGTTTMKNSFRDSGIDTVPSMNSWDMSAVTDMYCMFESSSLFNQDISSWNTGAVTSMYAMFYNAFVFNQNIGSWNTTNVINMAYMFESAWAFNQNISSWNTGSVTTMREMFWNNSAFNQNISNWNTGAVTNMNQMFYSAAAFNQNLASWNVVNVTDMTNMFSSSALSNANYSNILIGWSAQAVKSNVTLGAATKKYTLGAAADGRAHLVSAHTWTITDGGPSAFVLTYSAGSGGSIVGITPQTVDYGANGSEVTATPAANYHFTSWSDGVLTAARTETNVITDKSVTASFAIDTHTLTYSAGANGSVVGSTPQTVNYGANGSQVTATPAANYHFVSWSDDVMTAARTDSNVAGDIAVTASFALDAPASATGVTITPTSSTTFNVTWTDNSSIETGYKVYTADGNADCSAASYSGTPDTTTSADAVSQAIASKSVNTQYCAKVVATNSGGDSAPAYAAPKYTLANVPTFTTVAGDYSDADLWHLDTTINASANPAGTNYYIQYSTNDGAGAGNFYDPNAMAWQTETTYLFKKDKDNVDLAANTQYWMKVKAKNGDNVETIYTSTSVADVTPPAAPTALNITNICTTKATTTWTAATGADSYTVSYGTDTAATNIGTLTTATTSKQITGLSNTTTYYWKASATSTANGTGPYAAPSSFETSNCGVESPDDFAGSAASTTQINWTWSDITSEETGYKVEDSAHTSLSGNLDAGSTSYNETPLSANTGYTRHVNVYNGGGSQDSNSDTVYTLAAVPGQPTVTTLSSSRIRITVDKNGNPNANTRYAIAVSADAGSTWNYVKNADGTTQVSEDWQLYADWGGDSGFANTGLTKNTNYIYKIKARNGDNVATDFGATNNTTTLDNFSVTISSDGSGSGSLDQVTQIVDAGADVTTTATAAASSDFVSWTGCDTVATNICYLTDVSADRSITAVFTIKTYTITINEAGTGTGDLDQVTQDVNYGANLTVVATADISSTFTGWSGDATGTGDASFTNITANKTITATFTIKTYTITINTTGTGMGDLDQATQTVNYGANLTVVATPAASSTFAGWSGDATGTGDASFTNITANKTITATFTIRSYTVTISKAGNGTGDLDQSTQVVTYGANLTVAATPAVSSDFTGWSGDAAGTGSAALTNITADKTITATFTLKTYTISSSAGSNGAISPLGDNLANYGTSPEYTITPSDGYYISNVVVDGSAISGTLPSSYTFTNVTATHSISVSFAANNTCVWDGQAADDNWSSADNWTANIIPSATCDVIFDATSTKDSTLDASFTSHIKSLSVNTGYSGTISANTTLNDDGDFTLNAGTFTANAQTLNIAGSLTMTADPTAVFNEGTSTINFNPTTTGKTITTNGQVLGNLIFNGVDAVIDPNVTLLNNNISLLANHTLTAGWTFQDNVSAQSLTANAGTLVDGGKSVNIAGDIIIANKVGVLASTGVWTQSSSGNIANPDMHNTFGSLVAAGSGITSTMTAGVSVGLGSGSAGAFTVGPGTLMGIGKAVIVYSRSNDSVTVNNLTADSRLGVLAIYPQIADMTQKAITLPSNFATTFSFQQDPTGILTATGNFNFGNSNVIVAKDRTTTPAGYVDMSTHNLTCKNLTIGSTSTNEYATIPGYLKLGSGTTNIAGSLSHGNASNIGNKLDLGSGTINVGGNWDTSNITVTPGTSTVDLTGTGTLQSKGYAAAPYDFYNLKLAHNGNTTNAISSVTTSNVLYTYAGGTLNGDNRYAFRMYKSDGDAVVNTGANFTASTFLVYRPSSDVTVAGQNFGQGSVAYSGVTNDVAITLSSDVTTTRDIYAYSITTGKRTTLNAVDNNLTARNLYLAYPVYGVGTANLGSGTHEFTNGIFRYTGSTDDTNVLNLESSSVSIGGNIDFTGMTVDPGTSTITLNGIGGQTVAGSNTFNNLSATASAARTISFASDTTQTVNGALSLNGTSAGNITLSRSGGTGTDQWKIDPKGSTSTSYLSVENSKNLSSAVIDPSNSINLGNTNKWFPPTGTISFSSARTNQIDQTLTLSSSTGTQMKVSNSPDFSGSEYETFSTSKSWTLAAPTVDGMKTVYLKVKDIDGDESPTASASIILDITAPSAPTNLTALSASASVSLSWVNPTDTDFANVAIFRSTEADFTPNIGTNKIAYTTLSSTATYIDSNVTSGVTYYYKVEAIDSVDNYSAASNQASGKPDSDKPTAPGKPTVSGKTNTIDNIEYYNQPAVTLTWPAATDTNSGILNYSIKICKTSGCANANDALSLSTLTSPSNSLTLDGASALADGTYYVRVAANDNLGNQFAWSEELTFILDTVLPSSLEKVEAFDISDRVNSDYRVMLRWKASTDTGSGLLGYTIVKNGNNIISESTSGVQVDASGYASYVDTVTPNTQFNYSVFSFDLAKNQTASMAAEFQTTTVVDCSGCVILPPDEPGEGTLEISDVKATPSELMSEKAQATITWKTTVPATTQVKYGASAPYPYTTEVDTGLNSFHTVVLSDLDFNKTYHFAVISKDKYGQTAESTDFTFATKDIFKEQSVLDTVISNLSGTAMKVRDIIGQMQIVGVNNSGQPVVFGIPTSTTTPASTAAVAGIAIISAAAAPLANAATLFSLPEYIRSLIFALASLGTKKSRRKWGRVLEVGTYIPIAQAKLTLFKLTQTFPGSFSKRPVANTYSDIEGNFSFVADPGKYEIEVTKDLYEVSEAPGFYKKGQIIEVKSEQEGLIVPNILLSMNDKSIAKRFSFIEKIGVVEKVLVYVSLGFLIFGTVSILNSLAHSHRDTVTLVSALLFPLLWYVNIKSFVKVSPWGNVLDSVNHSGVSLALVRIMDGEGKRLIRTAVTNEKGKFSTVLPKGKYKLLVAKAGYKPSDATHMDAQEKLQTVSRKIEIDRDK
ncbi:MAG: BspA family leucine-rich repeat surface protein [Patescibacteria group bacterium]